MDEAQKGRTKKLKAQKGPTEKEKERIKPIGE